MHSRLINGAKMSTMQILSTISAIIFIFAIILMILMQFFEIKKFKNMGIIFSIIAVVSLGLLAYSSYFSSGSDIHRYYQMLAEFKGKDFAYAQRNGIYKNSFVTNLLFWLIAQTGKYQLLPMISTATVVACLCYIVLKENKLKTLKTSVVCVFFVHVLAITGIQNVISGVRQYLMVAIFSLAIYRDYRLGKRNLLTILLYLIACMIHLSALFFVLIRLCAVVKGKLKFLYLFWALLIPFAEMIPEMNEIVEEALFKLGSYQEIADVDIRLYIVQIIMLVVIAWKYLIVINKTEKSPYLNFMGVFILFNFGSIAIMHLFIRQVATLSFLCLPLFSDFNAVATKNQRKIGLWFGAFLCLGLLAYQAVFAVNYWEFISI